MKYSIFALLLICSACQQEKETETVDLDDPAIWLSPDSTKIMKDVINLDSAPKNNAQRTYVKDQNAVVFEFLGAYICCDTIRTFNHTAVVKSILDTAGNLTGFEIVKVLK